MFIYFPEFFYKNTLNYIQSTFRSKIDEKISKELISKEINENDDIKQIFSEFRQNKIRLPTILFEHCRPKFFANQTQSININLVSNYNNVENTITICKNKIESEEDLILLFKKEISFAYDMNLKMKNKENYNLKNYSIMSINACNLMIKNMKQSKLIKNELIRRCSYLELKYKFMNEIKAFYENEYSNMEDLKLNEIAKNLIDQNFI